MMVAVEMLFGNPHVFRVLYQQVAERKRVGGRWAAATTSSPSTLPGKAMRFDLFDGSLKSMDRSKKVKSCPKAKTKPAGAH